MKTGEDLIKQLNWRYATKKFDPSKKIDASTISTLEEVLRLSASSYGLQPWKFVIVSDGETKKQLSAAAFNQPQPADCSHLVVISRVSSVDMPLVDRYVDLAAQLRPLDLDKKAAFRGMLGGFVQNTPEEVKTTWSAGQCYIALGFLLSAAAALGVDGCPMEGFDKAAFDRILDLPARGCNSVVLCALGYRSADDHNASAAKVRFAAEEVLIKI